MQRKKEEGKHSLRIATIFSYATNEDDADANGFLPEELSVVEEPAALYGLNKHSREKLDEFIVDYNKMFETKFSTKDSESFYNYYNDIDYSGTNTINKLIIDGELLTISDLTAGVYDTIPDDSDPDPVPDNPYNI